MRNLIARILYILFYYKIVKEAKRKDIILSIYGHDQQKEPFEKMIKWLITHGYKFITAEKLYDLISQKTPLDKKYVWLSFDDGWKSGYDNVLPILKKYNIPATFFIATKGIDDGYYWFLQAKQNRNFNLYNEIDELWKMSNAERKKIIEQLPPYIGERITMNVSELQMMQESGFANFGNHTHDHVMSDKCTKNELSLEIDKCSEIMKSITGDNCSLIYSYPNGNMDNMSRELIIEKGFKMAATTKLGYIRPGDDPYYLFRNEFKNGTLEENLLQIYNIWTPFFNNIKKILRIQDKK